MKPNARARAITWMFAALNTIEPPIVDLQNTKLLEADKSWHKERLPIVLDRIRERLAILSGRFGEADWLDGAFSAGDLMMISVLLRLKPSGMLDEFPRLAAYAARGEARPAYQRAFAAQLAVFTGIAPNGWMTSPQIDHRLAGALPGFLYCRDDFATYRCCARTPCSPFTIAVSNCGLENCMIWRVG
jgi:hypothetical protein